MASMAPCSDEAAAAELTAEAGEKHAVAADEATPATTTAAEGAGADEHGGGGGGVRLPESLVNYILAREPEVFEDPDEYYDRLTNHPKKPFSQEYIDESTTTLRRLAESSKRIFAKFQKFQARVRAEFEEKGCVEVDDDYVKERVLWRQAHRENLPQAFRPMEGLRYADDDDE